MNALIAPVVTIHNGVVTTLSTTIAEVFEKPHNDVLKRVRALIAEMGDRLGYFSQTVIERENPSGGEPIRSPAYELTRDGFTLLAMGFTGKKALQFKLAYIDAFNRMEAELHQPPALLPRPPIEKALPGYKRHSAAINKRARDLALAAEANYRGQMHSDPTLQTVDDVGRWSPPAPQNAIPLDGPPGRRLIVRMEGGGHYSMQPIADTALVVDLGDLIRIDQALDAWREFSKKTELAFWRKRLEARG